MNFESFNFHPHIAAGVKALGYITPTPIQLQAIPLILQGQDIMALAQTGTGKTAAFVLPILQRLMQGPRGCVRALIIAPTRELAEQIHEAIGGLGQQTRLRSVTIYGGVNMGPQVQRLLGKAEIVVACPGRLLDHIRQGTIDLSRLEVLVLDEADRMFDMGFLPDIRKILKHLPAQRQTLFFSATMPEDIRCLAHDILRNPATVQINHTMPVTTISHALYPVERHLKTALLMALLHQTDMESVLVFTRTKHRAKQVARQLGKAGYSSTSLQGNLSQNQRQIALTGFRNGSFKILVATDIAARGIDVSRISHVINYDMPDSADAYTHRIGRTGRAAKTGDAFTLITREDAQMVRTIENVLGEKLERCTLQGFNYIANSAPGTEDTRHQPQHHRKQGNAKRVKAQRSVTSRPCTHKKTNSRVVKQRSPHATHKTGTLSRSSRG
ncbi:MAG: DEAD/DEAH box helicase [Candidatus Loosdrechtia sp.]|uniref:DEAD/DEAH box helicase n=1 Tax=Candidatus Loosdrechtia sp. TaxID=3101272 RepID=UPI003A71940C|nr:MAG: DEAD/DEAH box helicase [Candidatus Jettenia sp. AMX2]